MSATIIVAKVETTRYTAELRRDDVIRALRDWGIETGDEYAEGELEKMTDQQLASHLQEALEEDGVILSDNELAHDYCDDRLEVTTWPL